MKFHKILTRQLGRHGLDENNLPTDFQQWQDFLRKINTTYNDVDQERYLLERSMDISSREMQELNNKLEAAQRIARLGYWSYDQNNDTVFWSKEIYTMLGMNPLEKSPTYLDFQQLVHERDRDIVDQKMKAAFSEGANYELEIQMRCAGDENKYCWYYVAGAPEKKEGAVVQVSGILMDITRRKKYEEELIELHQQLLTTARRAGMADVATSVLHNIGNVLNSANVSMNLIQENICHDYYKKLFTLEDLLVQHHDELQKYLNEDPQGKLIPNYMEKLLLKIKELHAFLSGEINTLRYHLDHIKNITEMQHALSGKMGLYEKVFMPEIIDDALKLCGDVFKKNNIEITKEYLAKPFIVTDKSKLLQILINLLQNARDAVVIASPSDKEIKISLKKIDTGFELTVEDNGVGILPENLTRIFSFGFTTKKTGHGFGLHSSALVAKDLEGKLIAESAGIKKGAKFTLTLPLQISTKDAQNAGEKAVENFNNR